MKNAQNDIRMEYFGYFIVWICLFVSTNKKTQLNIQSANRSNYNFGTVKRVEKNFIKRDEIVSKWFYRVLST